MPKESVGGCPMSILHNVVLCDLVELSMVDFDVILFMDWLHASYATIDYHTYKVKFQFLNEFILEWKGSSSSC